MQARIAIALVGTWIAAQTGILPAFAQNADIAVVVSSQNAIDNLSASDVRRIFTGEKRSWAGNIPIKLLVRAPGAREREVLLKMLNMSESEFKQYWTGRVFRGDAQAEPIAVFSNGMQKEAIALYPGAIALMNIQDVKPGMKIVRVDGHKPGEAGYPLQ